MKYSLQLGQEMDYLKTCTLALLFDQDDSQTFKIKTDRWWNKGKQSSQSTSEFTFASRRMALIYCILLAYEDCPFFFKEKNDLDSKYDILELDTNNLQNSLKEWIIFRSNQSEGEVNYPLKTDIDLVSPIRLLEMFL